MTTYPTSEAIRDTCNMRAAPVITIQAICKKYQLLKPVSRNININLEALWALNDVSFDVRRGEILGIIGRNGAGKTTLLNIIAGTLSPTKGEIKVHGMVLGLFNLGVGFQDELTGRENIFLNGALIGATRKELEHKLDAIIEFSELGNFIDMPLGTYSQGMRLRLAFSIIVNLEFDILVLDEVLAVGDALFQSKCFERLMDFRRSEKTLIITTQDMGLIERLCDTVALLDHGRLLFYGGPAKGISRYRALLNTEKFFVGPAQKSSRLIENTKRWTEDISGWGQKLGTKEVIIESVEFINKFGWRSDRVGSGEALKIKVCFRAMNSVKEPHFGIAIFRNDGVYCYGPNTAFDGYSIPVLSPGSGYFILSFHNLLLAPGEYSISVAIWDKNETIAFNYHNGCYRLIIEGSHNAENALLSIPSRAYPRDYLNFQRDNLDLSSLNDKWGQKIESERIKLASLKLLNHLNQEKELFMTNEPVKLVLNFHKTFGSNKQYYLWCGFYRDDGVYCQGSIQSIGMGGTFEISFPKLPLLPGGYRVSIGIWDNRKQEFAMCHHAVYLFRMAFNREDHGTVYLEHQWKYKLPTIQ